LGANGQGKSTLVKTIARAIPQLSGVLTEGRGLNIGYFAQQELDVLRPEDTPLEHMIALAKQFGAQSGESSREQDLRNFLGTFNFDGDMVKQSVGTMSGGEKARLVLAMIVWQRPNLLLLDEPTNHLDLATREALSVALNEFEGTVMLVSHDRALLRSVCDEFWLVGRGEVKSFDGDLDDYQVYLLEESKRLRDEAKQNNVSFNAPVITKQAVVRQLDGKERFEMNNRLKPVKKSIESIEKKMAALNSEKTQLEALFETEQTPSQIAESGKRLKVIQEDLDLLEMDWLSLQEELEQIETAYK
jgi:ATP-binding cassette subfamily F protein 3